MRVIFNQSSSLGVRTGVGHYTSELARCLSAQAGDLHIDGYPRRGMWWARKVWSGLFSDLQRGSQSTQAAPSPGSAMPLRHRAVQRVRGWGRTVLQRYSRSVFFNSTYDLYHEPNFIPFPSDIPTLTTLHDLSVLLHPEWHPADRVQWFERHFRTALSQSIHFITGSESVRQEVIQVLGIAPHRITRAYYGVRSGLMPLPSELVQAVLGRLGLPQRYLLYVGTIEPRKNVLRLMQAYCDLPGGVRERWPLLLVGCWGWNAGPIAEYYHAEARHRGVHHVGYVSERHLPVLYNGARALVFPSHYEGLGLPTLEMMACGGAVLASTAAAVREAVGPYAHLVDPEDIAGWRDGLARVVSDEDWWKELRDDVTEQARPFTWERCADIILQLYRTVHRTAAQPAPAERLAA